MSGSLTQYLLSITSEPAQMAALILALASAWPLARLFRQRRVPRWLWWALPLCAGLLSWLYLQHYLRGGPRIIDATAYLLQARGLADGQLSLPLEEPHHSTLGRFLLHSAGTEDNRFSVIFPPGYPALLAVGMRLGAPLLVGPLLAIAITAVTMGLARTLARSQLTLGVRHGPLMVLSGCLALVCGAMRYHTADTMSHGAAALWWCAGLWSLLALAGGSGEATMDNSDDGEAAADHTAAGAWRLLLFGGCWGALWATRPASALALGVTALAALWLLPQLRRQVRSSWLPWLLLGCLPGVALWLAHQQQATGRFWDSAQSVYYALSDGPPGCFRYGFGAEVGCRGEHGQFVAANLPQGFGIREALATSGRRLLLHAGDALNTGPLMLVVLLGAYRARHCRFSRLLVVAVLAQMLAYLPFYFDGNYPGGGARMFADILPVEHVLAASGWLWLLRRTRRRCPQPHLRGWGAAALVVAALLGFGLHRGSHHAQLREREGGWPMYQPQLTAALPDGALLLLDTDHGFNLARALSPRLRIARRHASPPHDAGLLDRWRWSTAGEPAPFRYDYWVFGPRAGHSQVTAVRSFATPGAPLPAADLWPPQTQRGGYAWPRYRAASCLRSHRVLLITPRHGVATIRLAWPRRAPPPTEVSLWADAGLLLDPSVAVSLLPRGRDQPPVRVKLNLTPGECRTVPLPLGRWPGGVSALEFTSSAKFAIDALTLRVKR